MHVKTLTFICQKDTDLKTVSYDGFRHIVWALLPLVKDGRLTVEEFGRATMLSFGDVSTIPSGLVSSSLVWYHEPTKAYYRNPKVTHEHYITRTNTCRTIANTFLDGNLTEQKLTDIIEEGRMVHFVSEDENLRLRVYQQSDDYPTWQEQYAAAGIELVPDPGTMGNKTYYYIIEGEVFKDKHEVVSKHGISYKTVVSRCRSKNSKWLGWEEYKY